MKVLHSIKEIAAAEWDGLGSRVIFETHGWLSANESTVAGDPLITLEYEGAELRSAIAWQVTDTTEPSPYYNIESLLARFSELLGFAGEDGLVVFAGENSLVIRSHLQDTCTGFAVFFRMGEVLHAVGSGFDDSVAPAGTYFECVYHAAIEWAGRNGIKEIDYGVSATVGPILAKAKRGCSIVDVSTWYLPGAPTWS